MSDLRYNWTRAEVLELFNLPFNDLLFQAHSIHRRYFNPNRVQLAALLSVKTGTCPEDCAYCSQSGHYKTGLQKQKLLEITEVVAEAKKAQQRGATRFCMGAAWRSPPKKDLPQIVEMVKAVKALGMETCVTAGMLTEEQAQELKSAGLDYYNHNLDTSPEYYEKIISTRSYQDRLDTLENVRAAGIHTCCGGIIGMGECREDRAGLLVELANLPEHPPSVPINLLIAVKGTPLGDTDTKKLDSIEFIRTVAIARIMMPKSVVRLSAGRTQMSQEMQAMCFFAGANCMWIGEKLLTAENPEKEQDLQFLDRIGIEPCQTAEQVYADAG